MPTDHKRRNRLLPGLDITVSEHDDARRGHCFVEHPHDLVGSRRIQRDGVKPQYHAFRGWDRHRCSENGIGAWPDFVLREEIAMRTEIAIGVCTRCGATSAADAQGKCQPERVYDGDWSCPAEDMWEGEE